MPHDLDQEIDNLAKSMEKNLTTPEDQLKSTIHELGPEGVKKALPYLSTNEKILLKSMLKEELEKAQSMDSEYTPPKTKTKAENMETESLTGSDDEDEDLVDSKNAKHPHQGTPTDGWEGQEVKDPDESVKKSDVDTPVEKSKASEEEKTCGTKDHKEHHKELDERVDELEKKKKIKKSEGSRGGKVIGRTRSGKPIYASHDHPSHSDFNRHDHIDARNANDDLIYGKNGKNKNPDEHHVTQSMKHHSAAAKQFIDEMQPNKKMKKSEESATKGEKTMKPEQVLKAVELFEEKGIEMPDGVAALLKKGVPLEEVNKAYESLVATRKQQETKMGAAESGKQKKLLKEEDQVKQSDQTDGKKKKIPEEDGEAYKVKNQSEETADEAVDKAPKMKKSINWQQKNLLAANTLGRNCHYNTVDELERQEEIRKSCRDNSGFGPTDEELAKGRGPDKAPRKKRGGEGFQPSKPDPEKVVSDMQAKMGAKQAENKKRAEADKKFEQRQQASKERGADRAVSAVASKMKKSDEEEVTDLNDMLEKGMDYSQYQIDNLKSVAEQKAAGIELKKSFNDEDLMAAMGMTPEEYKKVLGEE